jgi:hypothetical protein
MDDGAAAAVPLRQLHLLGASSGVHQHHGKPGVVPPLLPRPLPAPGLTQPEAERALRRPTGARASGA